jgi:hypothetical protein
MNFSKLGPAAGRLDGIRPWATRDASSHAGSNRFGRGAAPPGYPFVILPISLDYYGLQIARAGMIGFVFTHGTMVLPYGADNPSAAQSICITAP